MFFIFFFFISFLGSSNRSITTIFIDVDTFYPTQLVLTQCNCVLALHALQRLVLVWSRSVFILFFLPFFLNNFLRITQNNIRTNSLFDNDNHLFHFEHFQLHLSQKKMKITIWASCTTENYLSEYYIVKQKTKNKTKTKIKTNIVGTICICVSLRFSIPLLSVTSNAHLRSPMTLNIN